MQALLAAPFVGRTREYSLLLEQYYLARQGQTQVVLLEGEAGIGKTRLATEFLDWAVAQEADVLRGQAVESNRRLSYQPFIEALRPRIDQENASEDLLHDVWLAELARLLPELHERYPDLTRVVVAIAHYEQAWQLLTTQPMDSLIQANITVSDVHHLYVELGHAYELTRTWEQARPLYAAILDYLLKMVVQEDETSRVAKTQWYQAMLALSTTDLETVIPYGERALSLARSSGYPERIAQSLNVLMYVMIQTGAWEEYEHHATEVLAYYVTLQDRAMEANALCMLAHAHVHRGRLRQGITHALRSCSVRKSGILGVRSMHSMT